MYDQPEHKTKKRKPYRETYQADTPTPDPSQTTPGAPDIRNPKIPTPSDEELKKLSPDVKLDYYE